MRLQACFGKTRQKIDILNTTLNVSNYLDLYHFNQELLTGNFNFYLIRLLLKKIVYEKNDLTIWVFRFRFDRITSLRSIYQQQELEGLLCRSHQ